MARNIRDLTNQRLRSLTRFQEGPQLGGPVDPRRPVGGPGGDLPSGPVNGEGFEITEAGKQAFGCMPNESILACGLRKGLDFLCEAATGRKCADIGGGNGFQSTPTPQEPPTRSTGCPTGFVRRNGTCVEQRNGAAPALPEGAIGTPVHGRFGVGVRPVPILRTHRLCPPGMILGEDNICYDRLRKSERKWKPPRKPLLTGGERNAIRKAKNAFKKIANVKGDARDIRRAVKKIL